MYQPVYFSLRLHNNTVRRPWYLLINSHNNKSVVCRGKNKTYLNFCKGHNLLPVAISVRVYTVPIVYICTFVRTVSLPK